jgi:uncharacterized protein
MNDLVTTAVSLTSQWFIHPGCEAEVHAAVTRLAFDVRMQEPDTLTYLVHTPYLNPPDGDALQSLPPTEPQLLLFFEVYRNPKAFLQHVNGPLFTRFVEEFGNRFVSNSNGPYTTVQFLTRHAGFVRQSNGSGDMAGNGKPRSNQHPAVMFEIIAEDQASSQKFYSDVFGWEYDSGSDGFAYVHFPVKTQALLGGIGQTNPRVPGFEPGHNFYLLVDKLETAIARATAAGGKQLMPPAAVDGYRFAMIKDPEGNPIGLIEPFER